MNQKSNLLNCILNVDYLIAGVAFIVLVSVTFVGVIMRYVFGSPFTWLEELQLFCFIWMAFMGGCIVFRQGSHICIDILVDAFPQKMAGVVQIGAVVVNTGVLNLSYVSRNPVCDADECNFPYDKYFKNPICIDICNSSSWLCADDHQSVCISGRQKGGRIE